MTEIKIAVSDRMNKIIQDISDDLGIKKSEFVKSLVVENLRDIQMNSKERGGK
jgi:hypothetical protein